MDAENSTDHLVAAILLHQFELEFAALAAEFRNDPVVDDEIKRVG